jgi:DNA ligase-1
MLDALSLMAKGDKSGRRAIERAFNVTADIGEIARRVKRGGISSLARLKPTPGVPIRPSLAERIPDPNDIMRKLGPRVAIEPKLDGFRTAVHIWTEHGAKRVALFSRNLENTTHMFPEIVSAAKKLDVSSAILDGEAIGYDPKRGRFTTFQETVQRKRKYGVEEMAKKIPLAIFVFDILYLNGTSLLEEPFSKRRSVLQATLSRSAGALRLADQRVTDDPGAIEEELKKAVDAGLEGIVVKNLQSPYEAGSRGFHWVKFKPTSAALGKIRAGGRAGLPDTIDCVVMGAYRGRGKRAEFGVGGFLLGVRGSDGKYYTISRLGSGLSDEDFREMFRRIKTLAVGHQPHEYVVAEETAPDIWIRPSLVVEILSDEITLSPRHTAGRKKERGYSLRFPRLVRFREDKNPEDATTVSEVERMYRLRRKT